MLGFYILIFLACCLLLYFSGEWVIGSLMKIARFLKWREFVVAFFVMALAATLPNLFVGISSALHKIPQLSFGDVVGGNVVDLTIAVSLASLVAKGLPAKSRMVQTTSIFTIFIAILPLVLILDGALGRGDGIVLLLVFFLYIAWLFSKKERFTKVYDKKSSSSNTKVIQFPQRHYSIFEQFKNFLKNLGKVILGVILLLIAAEGIVKSASFFAESLNLPISLIGILIVGLGNALPETYFAVASAKKGETWMILGDLMGSVIAAATLVLGVVVLICPIKIVNFSPFIIARFFLIVSALFFLFFIRTDRKITKKEALFLLVVYILFVVLEISIK